MRHRPFRHLATVAAVGLVALAAACSSAPEQPRPAAAPTAVASPAPSAVAPPAKPTSTPATGAAERPARVVVPPPAPPTPRPCLGAVPFHLDVSKTGRPWPKLCMTVGGVLWLHNLGPGSLSASPRDKIDCYYEAGVYVCRLVETGTVQLKIDNVSQPRTLTLVIAKPSSPPKPSSACEPAATYRLDATEHGPPWAARCMYVGAVLRIENHGPDGFAVSPASNVSCWYEAGIRECRFLRAGTVTFTLTNEGQEDRTLKVVVVR